MAIDRTKPLEVCKIEACNLIRHKVKHEDLSVNKALQDISEEAGIPYGTLKKWSEILTDGFDEDEQNLFMNLLERAAGNAGRYMKEND